MTRQQAREQGLKKYTGDKSCPSNHDSERYLSSGGCVICTKERRAEYDKANPEEAKNRSREWIRNNQERHLATQVRWRENNLERLRELQRKSNRAYQKRNPEKMCANVSKRKAMKLRALPKWADTKKMEEIYLNRPKNFHVDHIIPLNGISASGLHCEFNLQYLEASANTSKGNRFTPYSEINGVKTPIYD